MSPGQDREVPGAYTARITSLDNSADVMLNNQAGPGFEGTAVPDTAAVAAPETVHDDATAAVFSTGAGAVSGTPPSAAPTTEGNLQPSVASEVEVEVASNDATVTAAIAVPNNTADVEVASIAPAAAPNSAPATEAVSSTRAEPEYVKATSNAAAVPVLSIPVEVEVTSNAAAAAPDNRVEMVHENAGILPNGEVVAVFGGEEGGGGGAQAREAEEDIVGDVVRGALVDDTQPLTSAGMSAAEATTETTSSTSWLGFLWKAKRAIVAATSPSGGSTTADEREETPSSPDGKRRLGAGWRPYPGAVLYRRDMGVVEDVGGVAGNKKRALRYNRN